MRTFILFIYLILLTGLLNAQDRDLQYFLEQAKLNSPLINKSKNSNKIIQLNIRQINAILSKPTVNLEANVLFAPIILHDNNSNRFELVSQDATNYTGYDLAFSDGGQYQAFASVEQPIFTGSIYRQYAEKADVASKINENNIELKSHEIEHLVSRQYILCLKSKKQSNISSELLKELKRQLEILKKLVENAIYKQTDLMLLQIEIQNYELDYKKYLADYRNNLFDLYILCGIDDTNSVNISETDFILKPDISYDSKFLTSYALDSLNLKVEQSLFELKYIPQFNLFFNAGMNAIYLPSFNRFGFSTGINFSWNIFDGKAIPDGVIKYWYDGEALIDHEDVMLRTGQFPNMKFNQFLIAPYIGDGSPIEQTMWIDDLTVATSRVNTQTKDLKEIANSVSYAYPNPLGESTNIKFEITEPSLINLTIYDILGNEISKLVDEYKPAGEYNIQFNSKNIQSGIYYYVLQISSEIMIGKMVCVK